MAGGPSDLYVAAHNLVAVEGNESATLADRSYAVHLLREALAAEGEPEKPKTSKDAGGSVTTTWWDGTWQVVDADGAVVTPRTTLPPARPEGLAADEIYDDATGQVFKTFNVEPAGTTKAAAK